MKRLRATLMCSALLFSLPIAALPPLGEDARLLAFGDSLTLGVGGSGEGYPQVLSRLLHRVVIAEGAPGNTTEDGRRALADALQRVRPDLLLLCLGSNDLRRGLSPERASENLSAMLDIAKRAGVPVLMFGVPAPGQAAAHSIFQPLASAHGVAYDADSFTRVMAHPALKADLAHPNREGYRAIAESVRDVLRTQGALRRIVAGPPLAP